VIQRFSGGARRLAELWCLFVAGGLAVYFAGYAIKTVRVSYKIHDVSQGADATPLWIPQSAMAVGAVIFALALVDRLIAVARGADPKQDPLAAPGAQPADRSSE
jgi:TRAP-type C4-dicarboxylate transport system permease small subunit